MKKATDNDILNQVQIAAPCAERWESMPGGERVRSCARCQHKVYNLSEMSAAEAAGMIRNAEGRICVRLYRRADGSVMTQDCPTGLRAARQRVVRAAGVAFASALSMFGILSLAERRHAAPQPALGDVMPTSRDVVTHTVVIPDPTLSAPQMPDGEEPAMPVMGAIRLTRPATPLPMAATPDPDKTFLPRETPAITREDPFAPLPKAQAEGKKARL